jgi:hypothetical protein
MENNCDEGLETHAPLAAMSSANVYTGVFVCFARVRMRSYMSSDWVAEPPASVTESVKLLFCT